jgi:CheY-like chemotaxis protein
MSKAPSQAIAGLLGQAARRPLVLLAAALETNHLILKTMLELHDVEVVAVGDEEAAVNAALNKQPDLILMDLDLAQQGGATFRRIRACAEAGQAPIVFMTGCANDDLRNAACAAGCAELLVKPISYYAFYRTLKRYLFNSDSNRTQNNIR